MTTSTSSSRITVVIPTFNSERTIARALLSLDAQTEQVSNAIVVDDASSDATVAVVRGLPVRFPVTIIDLSRNDGPASARQAGIDNCTTEYVGFLDADDEWHPDHVSRALTCLQGMPEVGAVCAGAILHADASDAWPEITPQPAVVLSRLDVILGESIVQSSVIARITVVREAGGYRRGKRYAEDYDLWLRMRSISGICSVGENHVRRYSTETQVSRKMLEMVEGKWEALAYFVEWSERRFPDMDRSELLGMLDRVLDSDMRHARASWKRRVHSLILRYARQINPDSPRVRAWSSWLRYVWPSLRTARFLAKELPFVLRERIKPASTGQQHSLPA